MSVKYNHAAISNPKIKLRLPGLTDIVTPNDQITYHNHHSQSQSYATCTQFKMKRGNWQDNLLTKTRGD